MVSINDDRVEGNDDDAKEGLSLQIVEETRMTEATKGKLEKFEATVIDSLDTEKSVADGDKQEHPIEGITSLDTREDKCPGVLGNGDKQEDVSVGVLDVGVKQEDNNLGALATDDPIPAIKSLATDDPITAITSLESKDSDKVQQVDETTDNIVLRKLLREARYFDPLEDGSKEVNSKSENRKKPCFVCASFRHPGSKCRKSKGCFLCRKRGHYRRNCPEKHNEICLRCGDVGHPMLFCSREYDPEDLKGIQCYVCKQSGHLCCVEAIKPELGEVSCYNCGESGHSGAECAKPLGKAKKKSGL